MFGRTRKEVDHTRKIGRGAHVHGIGDGGDTGSGFVLPALEITGDHVVGVGGGDELFDGQTQAVSEESGGEITEVSGGDDKGRLAAFGQLAGSLEVVKGLGNEPRNINGVGRSEVESLGEFAISEGGFDEALAVIEGAAHFESSDVPTESGELFFLEFRDSAFGVENDHLGAGHVVKRTCHRAAGVAGGGHKDGQFTVVVFGEVSHKPRHEAGTEIFESESRSVEKFEDGQLVGEGMKRSGEVDCLLYQGLELFVWDRSLQDVFGDLKAEFAERQVAPSFPKGVRKRSDLLRHVKSAVSRQGAEDCFLEGLHVLAVVGGIELGGHVASEGS